MHLRNSFIFFKLVKGVKQWTLCHTENGAPLNPSIAQKMGRIKHTSYKNPNLEGKLMVEENVELNRSQIRLI